MFVAFIFIASTGMHSASGTKKNQEKKMQHAGFTEWNHSSGLQGLDFFYIFVLLCFSATLSIGMLSS